MATQYASGKYSIAECDRCGQRFKLKELKKEIIKTRLFNIKVCPECWDPDQPQLSLGMYPVYDPQAVMQPRPDVSYRAGGTTGLLINENPGPSVNQDGYPTEGSRVFQWGWNPIGGASQFDTVLTPNDLIFPIQLGQVSIST